MAVLSKSLQFLSENFWVGGKTLDCGGFYQPFLGAERFAGLVMLWLVLLRTSAASGNMWHLG